MAPTDHSRSTVPSAFASEGLTGSSSTGSSFAFTTRRAIHTPPFVTFIDPKIQRARHQGPDGTPCLFPPSAWTRFTRASEFHAALERWLGYHVANHFPRELAIYELRLLRPDDVQRPRHP